MRCSCTLQLASYVQTDMGLTNTMYPSDAWTALDCAPVSGRESYHDDQEAKRTRLEANATMPVRNVARAKCQFRPVTVYIRRVEITSAKAGR